MSPASCKALAFADSSFRCFAISRASSAAFFVFSHSSRTSAILICPVICLSSCIFSGTTMLICPSESSPIISWKLIFKESSISSSVSNCGSSFSSSSSLGSCRYGISSTIFLILSIVSDTVSFSVASRICCIPFAISS